MKIQLPRMVSNGINQYGKLELCVNDKFLSLWAPIDEEHRRDSKFTWSENPQEGIFRVRVDDCTQFFNSKSELIDYTEDLCGCKVTCIIDVIKVYNYKGYSGISCRVHQLKIHEQEYLFTE